MVEVIKHGEKNIIDCNFCGAQLRYSVDDIKEQEKYLSQRDSYFEKYIVCPDCKNKVVIKWSAKGGIGEQMKLVKEYLCDDRTPSDEEIKECLEIVEREGCTVKLNDSFHITDGTECL